MRDFDYHKLAERTWDNEILSYISQILTHKGQSYSHNKYKLSDIYSLVGIVHSHPFELDVALSIPDFELHGKMKNGYGVFLSLLLNPQKKQIASYYNSVCTPVDLELLMEDGLAVNKF